MRHTFFANLGMAIGTIPALDFPGVDKQNVRRKFETVCRLTLGFINTYVKDAPSDYWNSVTTSAVDSADFIEVRELRSDH